LDGDYVLGKVMSGFGGVAADLFAARMARRVACTSSSGLPRTPAAPLVATDDAIAKSHHPGTRAAGKKVKAGLRSFGTRTTNDLAFELRAAVRARARE
jgi:hypothetical protein